MRFLAYCGAAVRIWTYVFPKTRVGLPRAAAAITVAVIAGSATVAFAQDKTYIAGAGAGERIHDENLANDLTRLANAIEIDIINCSEQTYGIDAGAFNRKISQALKNPKMFQVDKVRLGYLQPQPYPHPCKKAEWRQSDIPGRTELVRRWAFSGGVGVSHGQSNTTFSTPFSTLNTRATFNMINLSGRVQTPVGLNLSGTFGFGQIGNGSFTEIFPDFPGLSETGRCDRWFSILR